MTNQTIFLQIAPPPPYDTGDLVDRLESLINGPPGWEKDRPWELYVEALIEDAINDNGDTHLLPIANDFTTWVVSTMSEAREEIIRLRAELAAKQPA